ncbi:MBL fold metallo-hydrolase [Methanoculleus sp. FWC-SCC3]|uniref:MBL fold metallo-hydrolase n=1 Tax=Methanoculleus methanifontis TaxID=2584086 RepID=A0ABT8M4I4_9EURY|nr:MBL fold metallo-hydrolase [Methanoculleus sp. FWC-SCC3]MDN7013505.1 MBL fold metallo-hydrolase [Methanoculleus sp. FWC-SCC3]
MPPIPARYLICITLCACAVACLVTAGCSNPSGQPEIGSDLSGDLVVHFIDVGQGDSILVEFRDKTMLIDAGERGMRERVIGYLEESDVEKLDVVVATHAHSDHIGGLSGVISAYPAGQFVDAAQPHPTATYENLLALVEDLGIPYTAAERGQTIALDPDLEILILNPGAEPLGDINEDSVVLMVTYGEISYLFTGDAGNPAEESMAEAGLDLDADVLKVGHHASREASSAEFLTAVSPAISIIPVGEGNSYGHPHEEAVERLEATGSRIYRTDLDGTVIVATDGTALTVAAGGAPAATVTAGATTAATTATPTVTATPAPSSGIYITDLDLQEEWIAVANADETAANLTGWTITDEGTRNTYTFPVYTLDPGADVTVHSGAGNDTATDLYWGRGSAVWNNDGDLATLADANGTVVSTMER